MATIKRFINGAWNTYEGDDFNKLFMTRTPKGYSFFAVMLVECDGKTYELRKDATGRALWEKVIAHNVDKEVIYDNQSKKMDKPKPVVFREFKQAVIAVLSTKKKKGSDKPLSKTSVDDYAKAAVAAYKWLTPYSVPTKEDYKLEWLNQEENYKALYDYVIDNYPNVDTRHGHTTKLSSIAYHYGFKEANAFFANKSISETKQPRDDRYEKGVVAPSVEKNFVPYDELEDKVKRDLLPPFNKIAEENREIYTEEEFKVMENALLGVLNVIEPNCRDALRYVKLVTKEPSQRRLTQGKEKESNYIWVQPNGICSLYILIDKVIDSMGSDNWDLSEGASKVIIQSMFMMPRKHLFPWNLGLDIPLNEDEYTKRLRETMRFDNGRKAGDRTIRHSQASYFFLKYCSPTNTQQKWLARRLRHTKDMMTLVYRSYLEGIYQGEVNLSELHNEDLPESQESVAPPPTPEKQKKHRPVAK